MSGAGGGTVRGCDAASSGAGRGAAAACTAHPGARPAARRGCSPASGPERAPRLTRRGEPSARAPRLRLVAHVAEGGRNPVSRSLTLQGSAGETAPRAPAIAGRANGEAPRCLRSSPQPRMNKVTLTLRGTASAGKTFFTGRYYACQPALHDTPH